MRKLISVNLAGNILLIFMGLLAIFHILVLFNVVPAAVVWGGQAGNSTASLVTLEIVALCLTFLFAVVIAAKVGYIKSGGFEKAIHIGMWIVFGYLVLNTLGNLASGVSFENLIFAPLTLILAFFAFRLAIEK